MLPREACARRPEKPHRGTGLNEGKGSRTKQWGQNTRGQKDKGRPGVEGDERRVSTRNTEGPLGCCEEPFRAKY